MDKTVVFCANTFWCVYQYRAGVIAELLRRRARVVVVAPADETSQKLREMGCQTIEVPLAAKGANPFKDARLLMRLAIIYRQIKPDFVFHFTIKPNIYGTLAARIAGVKSICVVTGLGYAFIGRGWVCRLGRLLYRLPGRLASQVWFLNGDDRREFVQRSLVQSDRARLLPGEGVDTSFFTPQFLPPDRREFVFLMIGRVLWDKGVGEFVKAASELRRKYPHVRFRLLGELGASNPAAVDAPTFDAWIKHGSIEYLGMARDVRPYIADADCVVLPSYREGLPRSLLEAAAMRRPVVATDVPGCRDAVRDGLNGYLCKACDADSLRAALERMVCTARHEQSRMGEAGRALVEREFDERLVIARYVETLQSFGIPERRRFTRPARAWRGWGNASRS